MASIVSASSALAQPQPKLDLHVVPTPIKSYRLLAMSMDDDGFIWAGAIHKVVHRYDPRTGKVEDFPIPFPATASACICVGKKVYILGQAYPKLIIYDRAAKKFTEIAYPSSKPNVWYGSEAIDGRHIFPFDRGGAGVIKWDTQIDSGKAVPWPYKAPFPSFGRFEAQDKAMWCNVWEADRLARRSRRQLQHWSYRGSLEAHFKVGASSCSSARQLVDPGGLGPGGGRSQPAGADRAAPGRPACRGPGLRLSRSAVVGAEGERRRAGD